MFRYLLIMCLVLSVLAGCSSNEEYTHQISGGPTLSDDWINSAAVPIKLQDSIFNDLQFLKEEIGDRRIVALGEQTHEDGKTFQLRARMTEFLMEEMGFEVVLFEAGMFDVYHANNLIKSSGKISDLPNSLYGFWRNAIQHERLFEYWQERLDNQKSLEFAGFDTKLTSQYGRSQNNFTSQTKTLLNDINSELLTHPSAVKYFSIWSEIEQDMAKGGIFSINFDMEEEEKRTLLELSTWVHDQVQKHNAEWAQMIKTVNESVVLYSDVSIYNAIFNQSLILDHVNNARDECMAENLLFLLEEKYADKKVILFGATYHFLRNNSALIHQPESQVPIEKSTIAVDILYPQLKDDLYVIGFTSGSGYYGNVDVGEQGDEVPTPVENSLEAQLLETDLDNAFISQRHTKSAPEFWEFGPHLNLFYYDIGYASTQWNTMLDALVYIRNMEPIYQRESDD